MIGGRRGIPQLSFLQVVRTLFACIFSVGIVVKGQIALEAGV